MTEQEWRVLVADPWAMARHQARGILRRPLDDFEAGVPAALALRSWAEAVIAADTSTSPRDVGDRRQLGVLVSETGILVSEGA